MQAFGSGVVSRLNDFNPDANLFKEVDKADLLDHTTELALDDAGQAMGPDQAANEPDTAANTFPSDDSNDGSDLGTAGLPDAAAPGEARPSHSTEPAADAAPMEPQA